MCIYKYTYNHHSYTFTYNHKHILSYIDTYTIPYLFPVNEVRVVLPKTLVAVMVGEAVIGGLSNILRLQINTQCLHYRLQTLYIHV